jgi:hypothetical protein
MFITSSKVGGPEKIGRLVLGVVMIPVTLAVPGLWKLIPGIVSVGMILTAFAGW